MRFLCVSLFSMLLLLLVCTSAQSQTALQPRTRAEFTAAMGKIHEGMLEEEVLKILGKPDDVRTQTDPGGISRVHTKEIWCYGTKSHLSFPTLGCVYIDEDGQSQESFGGQGQPPDMFKEEELRDFLRLLNTAPGMQGYYYDPLPEIQIVNRLQPLGKAKALAAIAEYIRVSDSWSGARDPRCGMVLVLAVLFDLPEGVYSYQAGRFGAPSPPPPKDPNCIPRFPIAIVNDIPLMLVNGYVIAGGATPMENVVDFYRVHGYIRPAPLVPSNDPLAAITHLTNSPQWIYANTNLQQTGYWLEPTGDAEREQSMLQDQLLRLIDPVCRLPLGVHGDQTLWGQPPQPTWENVVSNVSALHIKWDRKQNTYVLGDGSRLATVQKKYYARHIWGLADLGYHDAELIVERQNDSSVNIMVTHTEQKGAALRPATLFVFENGATNSPIHTFSFTNTLGHGSTTFESVTVALKADSEVRAKLLITGLETNLSPIFKP